MKGNTGEIHLGSEEELYRYIHRHAWTPTPKPLDIFSPEGGCSEGLDAFRLVKNKNCDSTTVGAMTTSTVRKGLLVLLYSSFTNQLKRSIKILVAPSLSYSINM